MTETTVRLAYFLAGVISGVAFMVLVERVLEWMFYGADGANRLDVSPEDRRDLVVWPGDAGYDYDPWPNHRD